MLTRKTTEKIQFYCGYSLIEITNKFPEIYPLVQVFINFVSKYRNYYKVGRELLYSESVLYTILDIFENGENRRNGYTYVEIYEINGIYNLPSNISHDIIEEISHNPSMLDDIIDETKIIYTNALEICNLQTIISKHINTLPTTTLDIIINLSKTKITQILDTFDDPPGDNGLLFFADLIIKLYNIKN